jgi:hypothetical protein
MLVVGLHRAFTELWLLLQQQCILTLGENLGVYLDYRLGSGHYASSPARFSNSLHCWL